MADISGDMEMSRIKGIIFDLDGVLVSTDELHYRAWKALADQESIYFDREINQRLRGVGRMESLEIILERASRAYTPEEKLQMAEQKNELYRNSLQDLTPDDVLPGVLSVLAWMRENDIRLAVGSSSKNAPLILEKTALRQWFDAVADGNQITHTKPDPEVFLLAAQLLNLEPACCAVVEDAATGIQAAVAAGCKAIAVGSAQNCPGAVYSISDLSQADPAQMLV